MTAFLYIPHDLLINEYTIRARCPEVAVIYDKHPDVFTRHFDAEYLVLILYVMHEQIKGEASFYHPYFEIVNTSDLPFLWTSNENKEF